MTAWTSPPRLPRWLIHRALSADAAEAIAGDLDERFREDLRAGDAPARVRVRYWRHAVASIVVTRRGPKPANQESPMRRSSLFTGVASDVRFILRGFGRAPGYVAVAVLSLAIGIGANVATLSVMRAVLLADLPVARPQELQWVGWRHPRQVSRRSMNFNSSNDSNFSLPAYQAVRAAAGPGIPILGFNFARGLSLNAPGRPPTDATGMVVSADYFSTLGLAVVLGRPLGAGDEGPGAPPVAVISDRLWQQLFDGEPRVIGRPLRINGTSFDVVGVTPRGYVGLSLGGFFPPTDVTLPLSAQPIVAPGFTGDAPLATDLTRQWIHVIARLPSSSDRERFRQAAIAGLTPIDAALMNAGPPEGGTTVTFTPASRGVNTVGRDAEQPLHVLSGASALVLLIACANLAGIMLARGVARTRDTAVRRALGARRATLMRQWLLEGIVLAAAGGAAGVLVAVWTGPAIINLLTVGLGPVAIDLSIDWRLLTLAIALTTATAVLSAAVPAWRLTRSSATGDLRTRVIGHRSPKLTSGRLLIAAQIAISVPLLVGALLFVQTLRNLSSVQLGFDPAGLVGFQLRVPTPSANTAGASKVAPPEVGQFVGRVREAMEAIPGVSSATVSESLLVSGISSDTSVTIDGKDSHMLMQAIGPRYFETMRIPLVAGRAVDARDVGTTPAVAVVNESAVDQLFHGVSPIGQIIRANKHEMTVVGVVKDSLYASLRRTPAPTFYDAYLQRPGGTWATFVTLRTTIDPGSLRGPIAAAIAGIDPTLPIAKFTTELDQIDATMGRERVFSWLLTLFATFAILLAGIGLYGLTAYAVARRTNEIGIRIALGAPRAQVQRLMLRQVVVLALVGLAAGVPLAWMCARFVATLVFGVNAHDAMTLGVVSITMLVAAVAAGWMPARRAARLEPLSALRTE